MGDIHPHLCFVAHGCWISAFFSLLQKGLIVRARVGCSLTMFLCEQGVTAETTEKIQSIFLDGKPVDDLDQTIIDDGSTLALSAAMPGLVGATLRRKGAYSCFRNTITCRQTGSHISGDGFVRIKLFNLLMAELGPLFLKRGVFVRSSDLRDFLTEKSGDFGQGFLQILLDGKPVEIESLQQDELLSGHGQVFLSVIDRV